MSTNAGIGAARKTEAAERVIQASAEARAMRETGKSPNEINAHLKAQAQEREQAEIAARWDKILEDFHKSDLDPDDVKAIGVYDVSQDTLLDKGFGYSVAKRASDAPAWGVESPTGGFITRFLDGLKPKYMQAPGSKSRLHFPSGWGHKGINWLTACSDPSVELWITEGIKKSERTCKGGKHCVAISGVWNWSNRDQSSGLIEDFKKIKLKGRTVVIVFDSDLIGGNYLIRLAMNAFAAKLLALGAKVEYIIIPPAEQDEKQGADDFIKAHGMEALLALKRHNFDNLKNLLRLNERYAMLTAGPLMGRVWVIDSGLSVTTEAVAKVEDKRSALIPDPKDPTESKVVYAGSAWPKWSQRREYKYVDYLPGQQLELEDGGRNLWKGWPVDPAEGDVSLWNELLDHVFQGEGSDEARKYFEQWVAHPIQFPGSKLFVATVLWGVHGGGKSLLGQVIGHVYGDDNFVEVDRGQLMSAFNEWSKGKQFAAADEILAGDKRPDSDKLKGMITRRRMQINEKFQPGYYVQDTINYLFTSNHANALFIEDTERRYFVWEVSKVLDDVQGEAIARWATSPKGRAALLYHFQHLDLTGFRPTAPALVTKAQIDMIEMGKTDAERLACELVNKAVKKSKNGEPRPTDLITVTWAAEQYKLKYDKTITHTAMGRALGRAGGVSVGQTEVKSGDTFSAHAAANIDHWRLAGHGERAKALEDLAVRHATPTPDEKPKF